VQAHVLSREAVGSDWLRFSINVLAVYKRPKDWPIRYTPSTVWVPAADLACRCPKLRVRKSYLLVGRTLTMTSGIVSGTTDRGRRTAADTGTRPADQGLVLDRNGIAMRWDDAWAARLKQFARTRQC